uniref:Uncharacterized protein n=1 Tax=Anguilla anguilla TaxID=7936 RepID=A0A0E9U246_ANGAN
MCSQSWGNMHTAIWTESTIGKKNCSRHGMLQIHTIVLVVIFVQ